MTPAPPPSLRSGPPAGVGDALLGMWRLARLTTVRDGAVEHPLGTAPTGRLSYERDGHMAVHLCKGPGAADGPMPDYTAYCGRYTLDRAVGTIVHHIEAGSLPQLAGTDQVRAVRLEGDRLVLSARAAGGETVLEWCRGEDHDDAPPPGFVPLPTPGFGSGETGRLYRCDRDRAATVIGTRIAPSRDASVAVDGALLAFAGVATAALAGGSAVRLTVDFLHPARIGDWIEARAIRRRDSGDLILADTAATRDGIELLRVRGLFRPLGKSA